MREKWVKALTKAKLEGEKNIRELLRKNKKTENEEFKDMIYPELSYDAELEQLLTAVTRLKMDNQNLMNFIESKNLKDTEIKILKERFQDYLILIINKKYDITNMYKIIRSYRRKWY